MILQMDTAMKADMTMQAGTIMHAVKTMPMDTAMQFLMITLAHMGMRTELMNLSCSRTLRRAAARQKGMPAAGMGLTLKR